jgi:hypothetical protein
MLNHASRPELPHLVGESGHTRILVVWFLPQALDTHDRFWSINPRTLYTHFMSSDACQSLHFAVERDYFLDSRLDIVDFGVGDTQNLLFPYTEILH